jgi:hypothetical protein
MKSNKQLVDELRNNPQRWVDAAIVVAFEDRFEFVGDDHPDAVTRLNCLQAEGGFPIGFAGLGGIESPDSGNLQTQVFSEYQEQAWAHRYMTVLRAIVRKHSATCQN